MARKKIKVGMKPPHPGAFIREEVIDKLDLSISKAADVLGVRRATLSDLLNERAALSPEMALRLEMAFGLPTETLLRMQVWYDSEAIRSIAGELNVRRYKPEHA